jgi:hypothetical protein
MTYSFTPAQPLEWFEIDTVSQILGCTPQRVLQLVQAGTLSGRGEHISSGSLDKYTARRPLFGRPAPETYVKVNGKVYREV